MNSLQPLIDRFPRLFHGRGPAIASGVGAGSMPLLMQLFERIDALLTDGEAAAFRVTRIYESIGELQLTFDLVGQDEASWDAFSAESEVRQRMRVLYGMEPNALLIERVTRLVRETEAQSAKVCERCGAPGVRRRGLWIKTLCKTHHDARLAAQRALEAGEGDP